MQYYIATVWVEGGRMGDGIVYREVVRLAASDPVDFRISAEALMTPRFNGVRNCQVSFGPISVAKNQQP